MDASDVVTSSYETFSPDEQASTLAGTFADSSVRAVVVKGERYKGVVTRRQLATSHHKPNQKVGSLAVHVPRLSSDEDVHRIADLMVESGSHLLPVFEEGMLIGVVTADRILEETEPFLDVGTVDDAFSRDLLTVEPDTSLARVLELLREHRITHLPVVENDSAVGIVSLADLTDLTVRASHRSQGGDAGGVDAFGGEISSSAGRSRRGGYGAREGELDRVLDLPVRDAMTTPVRTITPEETLDVAVGEMRDVGGSSLVVVEDGSPVGILTTTDILAVLTWEADETRAVQLYGADLLTDMTYEEVRAMIDRFDNRDHGMNVLDAKIHLSEHDETRRGVPQISARIRLHTDRGLYMASGEGFGASHALNEARDVLERRIRDQKTRGRSKKPPDEEFWDRRFGWLLEG